VSVIAGAYLAGVSTRRVEKLVQQLGVERMSKSQVSRLAKSLDGIVEDFRTRPLDGAPYAYVTLDALVVKCREGGRTVNVWRRPRRRRQQARAFCRTFFDWYNNEHRHSGIGLHDSGRRPLRPREGAPRPARPRPRSAYAATPERFVRGRPHHPSYPPPRGSNKPTTEEVTHWCLIRLGPPVLSTFSRASACFATTRVPDVRTVRTVPGTPPESSPTWARTPRGKTPRSTRYPTTLSQVSSNASPSIRRCSADRSELLVTVRLDSGSRREQPD